MTAHALLLLAGFVAPILPGFFILRAMVADSGSRTITVVTAWVLGKSMLTISLFALSQMGVPLGFWMDMLVYGVLSGTAYAAQSLRREKTAVPVVPQNTASFPSGQPSRLLAAMANAGLIGVLAMCFFAALAEPVLCRPGMAIWAYKAKVIATEHALPLSLLMDPDRAYMQPGYPLDYPLFLAWLYAWMGTVDDYAIKLVSPLLSTLLALTFLSMLRHMGIRRDMAALTTLLIASGQQFYHCATQMYAEHLLFLHGMLGFFVIMTGLNSRFTPGHCLLGGMLLASGAWVKNEGALYLLAAALAWMAVRYFYRPLAENSSPPEVACHAHRRQTLAGLLFMMIPGLLFVMPWQVILMMHSVSGSDFSLTTTAFQSWSDFFARSRTVTAAFAQALLFRPAPLSCLGIFCVGFIVFHWRMLRVSEAAAFAILSSALIIIGLFAAFFFSVRDVDWHLRTTWRILLGPSLVMMCGVLSMSGRERPLPHACTG